MRLILLSGHSRPPSCGGLPLPLRTGALTGDSQGVIRDLTGELTTGELTDDWHVLSLSC